MNRQLLNLIALAASLSIIATGLVPSPLAAKGPPEVDIQAEVYSNSVVFQVDTSRDLLSLNVRVVGPNRYLFEDRIELFGSLEWIPNLDLADGNYIWEAWVVTANPGVTMRDLPDGTSPEITIEHFYDFEVTQTHISSGGFRVHDGALEMPAERRAVEEATRVRRIAGTILNFLIPSAQAQNFTDNVVVTKSVPEVRYEHNAVSPRNWSTGYNPLTGWYVRDLTANTFPIVVRDAAPNNSLIVGGTGNIGIGTGSPSSKLDVVGGSVRIDNHLTVRNPSASSVTSLNLNADNNDFVSDNSWRLINDAGNGSRFEIREGGTTRRVTILQGGNVGIGTTAPQTKLQVQDEFGFQIQLSNSAASVQHILDSYAGELSIGRADTMGGAYNQLVIRPDAPAHSLTIQNNGNIGVGTGAPAFPIHVQRADNSARVTVEDTGATASADVLFMLRNNGNPQFRMENTATNRVWNFRTQDFAECSTANTCFVINKRNGPRFRFMQDGDMFIEGAYENSSSKTVKQDILDLDPEELFKQLEKLGVYEWRYQQNPESRHVGPMAEDFYAAFGLGSGEKSISPSNMAGISLAAVKVLATKVQSTQAENLQLHERLEAMESQIANWQ